MTDFSYQLYSSRNFPPLAKTLHMLADAGYAQVEGYGAMFSDEADLAALRAELDAAGLSMPTAHIAVDVLQKRPERAVEIAKTLGIEVIFGPHLVENERPTSAQGWAAFGRTLADAAKPLQDAGLTVGWHNHDFEFSRIEGELPMDLILAGSDTLVAEFDVAWCVKGGEDPLAWIAAHGAQIVSAHIKDIAPDGAALDEDGWADIGHGTMDWAALMAALRSTSCRYFIAEHDNPNDHRRFAERSIAAMRSF